MLIPYLNYEEYINNGGDTLQPDSADKYLAKASRHIDILTYGRIRKYKFENLTEFQQEIIKEVVINLADFEYDNEEILNNILKSYSINDVSMNFGETNWNLIIKSGVAMRADDYELLAQTGLTTATFRI